MKSKLKFIFVLLTLIAVHSTINAQITINGYNPRRYHNTGPTSSVSISYGYNYWVDGNNVPLAGYSEGKEFENSLGDPLALEKINHSTTISIGYERYLSEKITLKVAFATGKLATGMLNRADIVGDDRSKFTQLGFYSKYMLTKNSHNRVKFQWLAGPELIYAKKDVLIKDYVANATATPSAYRPNVTVVEVALMTGIGMNIKISNSISLFSDSMFGISLPGKGFKTTNAALGLKYGL